MSGSEKAELSKKGVGGVAPQPKSQDYVRNFILFQKFEDFCTYFFPIVERFPNREKWALCATIKNHCYEMVHLIIMAQSLRSQYHQHQKFEELDVELKVLRFYIRHAHTRKYLAHDSFETSSKNLDEIGRIIGRLLHPVDRAVK